jgi:putative membrane-bound dehydrogenase-like protein
MAFARIFLPLLLSGTLVPALAEEAPLEAGKIEVLFFGEDGPHQPRERYRIFKEVCGNRGIHLTFEERMDALSADALANYDVLLIYANHPPLSPPHVAAVESFVEGGGGLVAVHFESSVIKQEQDDLAKLVGGRAEVLGGEIFTARVVEPQHALMKGYVPFATWDETRRHRQLADDLTVLQRHGEEPWTWVRQQGKGRVFSTAHGHDERCWRHEGFHDLLERGIRWAAGGSVTCRPLPELEYEVPLLPAHYETNQPVPKIQSPLSPEDSMKRAQVPAGFELSLFAADPDVVNPIAITWDHRDRLWVVEALDYPNGIGGGKDRLKICEDTDGYGKADRFTVFADGLSIATSAVHANGGVIVTSGSQMLFLKDTDGDDKADERRVLFEGFKTHDTHAGVSNLRYGFDGWIYATIGYAGFEGTVGGLPVKFDTGVFRFLPDGSKLEFLGKTTNNTWGLGFTGQFDILGSTANRQASWQVVGDGGPVRRADHGTMIFPITQDVQGSDGWDPPVELLGDGRIRAKARHFTAAAGHSVYTAQRFPREWWNRAVFVCEPTGHLVSLGWLRTENADFFTEFDGNNLYASSDAWSAPVAAETGPDGAVWIADWYHIIVQHNRPGAPFEQTKVERGKGAAYVTPLRDRRMGRIYRVFPKQEVRTRRYLIPDAGKPRPLPPVKTVEPELEALDPAKPETLVAGFADPSLVRRLHAQRLIGERGGRDLIPRLRDRDPHALHALGGLGYFSKESEEGIDFLRDILDASPPEIRPVALSLWPAELPPPGFRPERESDPFFFRQWLLLAARAVPDEATGRKLHEWQASQPQLRRGEVLDRCFAAAAARHSTGFLLAALDAPPEPAVLDGRIFPAAIRAFAESRSPQILARIEGDPSPLAAALKVAVKEKHVAKKHRPPADQLARGEAIYARACAACHQNGGTGVDGAFPPLDGSALVLDKPEHAIRIVLHGLTGPVEVPGRLPVNSLMPPSGLADAEIADVLTFVRHAWSNDAAPVSAGEVAKVREATKDRTTPWTAAELRQSP